MISSANQALLPFHRNDIVQVVKKL